MFRPQWSPITVLAMILGFIVFWPLGLAVLAYILWGERFGWSPDRAERWVDRQKERAQGWCQSNHDGFRRGSSWTSRSGNAAFDEYREEQLKRLDEERRRLDEEVHEFHDYLRNLHMARDREEFDRFMRERSSHKDVQNGGDQTDNPTSV
ncbi:MAG TPA: DUF2852 domain-containing protein [Devosiaceae bacterium]|nr:DUF2852 domain-containing protein [Devosiaceae bacterium]